MDLARALEVAKEAARAAGARIREEFHRPGGPRGSDGKAPVDRVAEVAIRERLLQAFPEAGYLGEETGAIAKASAFRWVVDPNDGTRSYLRGRRGSAVSIALLHDELPVLGVVYAPLAPDDEGDLVAWAEGLPLTRNDREVKRPPLPRSLGPEDIVLTSPDADRNVAGNAACSAPARFRAMPSIAYRLALLAVGEGEAAISLNGPMAWELAAGHALLRAVGGELVNQAGEPVRYAATMCGRFFFGASLEVARTLAMREWTRVFEPGEGANRALARPVKGEAIADAALLRRAQGALLGQLAGDALGSMVEFRSAASIARAYPEGIRDLGPSVIWRTTSGQPTDDSELALALARTLVARGFDRAAIRSAYRAWLDSGPFDVGETTKSGLKGRPVGESQANGGLMRVSPLGIFGHAAQPSRLASWAREECAITHPHRVCQDASTVFTVAVAHAIRTGEGPREVWAAARDFARRAQVEASILEALEAAATEPPADFLLHMGWVTIAFQNAFFRLLHAPSLEAGVIDTVMAGGDTDTNAAIAGALLGAVHGREAIPLQWKRTVLTARAHDQSPHPRPPIYWPVDALELAERLLVAGRHGIARQTGP